MALPESSTYTVRMQVEEIIREQYRQLSEVVEISDSTLEVLGLMSTKIVKALRSGSKILCAGNGGSAADALHMAEELVGRYKNDRISLPAISLAADATALTCIGNDYGFEAIFSRQIEGLGKEGDIFVGFTTSGNSANIIQAVEAAKAKNVQVLLIMGKDGGKLRGQADLEWIVPSSTTARIQEMHGWAIHAILEVVESEFV